MPLLVVDGVTKHQRIGRRDVVALRDVSFDIAAGELVAVYALRRLERLALLRVCAGIDPPDAGCVRFDGRELGSGRWRPLGRGVALCTADFSVAAGRPVVDHVAVPARLRGTNRRSARLLAHAALERVGAAAIAAEDPSFLAPADIVRATLARGIVGEPRLLLVDDPLRDVDPVERDPLARVLRSLAASGTAVLATTAQLLAGVTRTLSLSDGALDGEARPTGAHVHALPARRRGAAR